MYGKSIESWKFTFKCSQIINESFEGRDTGLLKAISLLNHTHTAIA